MLKRFQIALGVLGFSMCMASAYAVERGWYVGGTVGWSQMDIGEGYDPTGNGEYTV